MTIPAKAKPANVFNVERHLAQKKIVVGNECEGAPEDERRKPRRQKEPTVESALVFRPVCADGAVNGIPRQADENCRHDKRKKERPFKCLQLRAFERGKSNQACRQQQTDHPEGNEILPFFLFPGLENSNPQNAQVCPDEAVKGYFFHGEVFGAGRPGGAQEKAEDEKRSPVKPQRQVVLSLHIVDNGPGKEHERVDQCEGEQPQRPPFGIVFGSGNGVEEGVQFVLMLFFHGQFFYFRPWNFPVFRMPQKRLIRFFGDEIMVVGREELAPEPRRILPIQVGVHRLPLLVEKLDAVFGERLPHDILPSGREKNSFGVYGIPFLSGFGLDAVAVVFPLSDFEFRGRDHVSLYGVEGYGKLAVRAHARVGEVEARRLEGLLYLPALDKPVINASAISFFPEKLQQAAFRPGRRFGVEADNQALSVFLKAGRGDLVCRIRHRIGRRRLAPRLPDFDRIGRLRKKPGAIGRKGVLSDVRMRVGARPGAFQCPDQRGVFGNRKNMPSVRADADVHNTRSGGQEGGADRTPVIPDSRQAFGIYRQKRFRGKSRHIVQRPIVEKLAHRFGSAFLAAIPDQAVVACGAGKAPGRPQGYSGICVPGFGRFDDEVEPRSAGNFPTALFELLVNGVPENLPFGVHQL
jgi:hypothetical protein